MPNTGGVARGRGSSTGKTEEPLYVEDTALDHVADGAAGPLLTGFPDFEIVLLIAFFLLALFLLHVHLHINGGENEQSKFVIVQFLHKRVTRSSPPAHPGGLTTYTVARHVKGVENLFDSFLTEVEEEAERFEFLLGHTLGTILIQQLEASSPVSIQELFRAIVLQK